MFRAPLDAILGEVSPAEGVFRMFHNCYYHVFRSPFKVFSLLAGEN
jgi:hypothetical protein